MLTENIKRRAINCISIILHDKAPPASLADQQQTAASNATPMQHQCNTNATPMQHQCNTNARLGERGGQERAAAAATTCSPWSSHQIQTKNGSNQPCTPPTRFKSKQNPVDSHHAFAETHHGHARVAHLASSACRRRRPPPPPPRCCGERGDVSRVFVQQFAAVACEARCS
jgi:hypothetical protein